MRKEKQEQDQILQKHETKMKTKQNKTLSERRKEQRQLLRSEFNSADLCECESMFPRRRSILVPHVKK